MHHLINLVVLCACASVNVSHVLSHTTIDLVDTASGVMPDSVIEGSEVEIDSLDVIFEHTASIITSSVVAVNRFRRSFIGTSNCPEGHVRLGKKCVTCAEYELIKEEDCPI